MSFSQHMNKFRRIMDNASKYCTYEVKSKLQKALTAAESDFTKGKLDFKDIKIIRDLYGKRAAF